MCPKAKVKSAQCDVEGTPTKDRIETFSFKNLARTNAARVAKNKPKLEKAEKDKKKKTNALQLPVSEPPEVECEPCIVGITDELLVPASVEDHLEATLHALRAYSAEDMPESSVCTLSMSVRESSVCPPSMSLSFLDLPEARGVDPASPAEIEEELIKESDNLNLSCSATTLSLGGAQVLALNGVTHDMMESIRWKPMATPALLDTASDATFFTDKNFFLSLTRMRYV
jgi:hypothetical protein